MGGGSLFFSGKMVYYPLTEAGLIFFLTPSNSMVRGLNRTFSIYDYSSGVILSCLLRLLDYKKK